MATEEKESSPGRRLFAAPSRLEGNPEWNGQLVTANLPRPTRHGATRCGTIQQCNLII